MAEILHQLVDSSSHYLHGFIHPKWLFGISEPSTVGIDHVPTRDDKEGFNFTTEDLLLGVVDICEEICCFAHEEEGSL